MTVVNPITHPPCGDGLMLVHPNDCNLPPISMAYVVGNIPRKKLGRPVRPGEISW